MPRRVLMGNFLRKRSRFDKPVSTAKLAERNAERQERRQKAKAMASEGKIKPEAASFSLAEQQFAQQRAEARAAKEREE